MQPEDSENNLFCKLCRNNYINHSNSEVIDEVAKEVLEAVLPNLTLEGTYKPWMCKACHSKLFAAFNFKSECMGTEDVLKSHGNASNMSVIDLKEIYIMLNGTVQLTDILENQRICRLCLQLVTYGFVSLNEVNNDLIVTYIPHININATKDPVICRSCYDLLRTHGGFVKNCLEAQETNKSSDEEPCIKFEEVKIKLEDCHGVQESFENVDKRSFIKSEEIEIKPEGDQDYDLLTHNFDEGIIENKKYIFEDIGETKDKLECETEIQIKECDSPLSVAPNKNRYKRKFEGDLKEQIVQKPKYPSEIQIYKCGICNYETKRKGDLNIHKLLHKDNSEIQMYNCNICTYKTKYRKNLKYHALTHKDPSEVQMYKCGTCTYETKYKNYLKEHRLIHKYPSEVQMYKCDECDYETKHKGRLKHHQLTHKDPAEIQMYRCDACDYESKRKGDIKTHQLTHKDFSKIQSYRCNECGFECKRKGGLKNHQLLHKDPSEIQMFKCDFCTYESRYKVYLKHHQLVHKGPSETQMFKCDLCDYESKRKDGLKRHQLIHKEHSEIQMYK